MSTLKQLGTLERAVMDHLWHAAEPQTVREVHEALAAQRALAYTTVMTVLRRLAGKGLVSQIRDDRAHRYSAVYRHDELVATLMVDALEQMADAGSRHAALLHFVEKVSAPEMHALRIALAAVELRQLDNLSQLDNVSQLGNLRPTA